MNYIAEKLEKTKKFQDYIIALNKKNSQIRVSGLSDVGKVQFSYCTKEATNKPICIVTYNEMQAKKIIKDLEYFTTNIKHFPKREIASYDFFAESKDLPYERIEVLNKIKENKAKIVVTTIEAIMQKMIAKEELYKNSIYLKIGDTYSLEKLKQKLIFLGYERCDLVESKGQFSVRGGIIDIGINDKEGVRIEFWGDDIDSIRLFKLSSQRSTDMLNEYFIYPAHEFLLLDETENIINKIENYVENIELKNDYLTNNSSLNLDSKFKNKYLEKIEENLNEDIELIKSGDYISKIDKYFNSFYEKQSIFLDYLNENFIILFDEMSKINQRIENITKENNQLIKNLIEKSRVVPESILNISNFKLILGKNQVVFLEKQDIIKDLGKNRNNEFIFPYRDINFYKTEVDLLTSELLEMLENKKTVIILGGNEANVKKICSLLTDKNIPHKYVQKLDEAVEKFKEVIVSLGALEKGFECYDASLVVISSEEFFSNTRNKKKIKQSI